MRRPRCSSPPGVPGSAIATPSRAAPAPAWSSTYSGDQVISRAPIFLPSSSGVRPTIRPATNTATMAAIRIPYRPDPDPAGRHLAQQHVEQHDAAAAGGHRVVHGVDRPGRGAGGADGEQGAGPDAELGLLALHRGTGRRGGRCRGRPPPPRSSAPGAAPTARPSPPARPCPAAGCRAWCRAVRVRHTGISSSRKISTGWSTGVGFSYGWAEFALKKPPPLVPSCLIASWLATGPPGRVWVPPAMVMMIGRVRSSGSRRRAAAGWRRPADRGNSTRSVIRTRSTQKLPRSPVRRAANPRSRAAATAMPTAAETKFWTARPAAWAM